MERSADAAVGDGVAKRAKRAPQPAPLLVISLEFTHSPFSGNGVLARSLVKGLLARGHTVNRAMRPARAWPALGHA